AEPAVPRRGSDGRVGRLALQRIRLLANGRSHGRCKVAAARRRGADACATVSRQASRDRAVTRAHDREVPKRRPRGFPLKDGRYGWRLSFAALTRRQRRKKVTPATPF